MFLAAWGFLSGFLALHLYELSKKPSFIQRLPYKQGGTDNLQITSL